MYGFIIGVGVSMMAAGILMQTALVPMIEECNRTIILRDVAVDGIEGQDIMFEDGIVSAIGGEVTTDKCYFAHRVEGIRIVTE